MEDRDRKLAHTEARRERPEPRKNAGRECPQCGTANDQEARFCAECGFDFAGKTVCPKCGSRVHPGADICEACGAWLLDSICKFCGAPVDEGQVRCGECGNPVEGLVCPKCGQLSFFDFCKACVLPLTEAAHEMVARVKSAPLKQPSKDDAVFSSKQEARRYYMAYMLCLQGQERQTTAPPGSHTDEREQLVKLKTYLEQSGLSLRKRDTKPLFTVSQKANIRSGETAADAEIHRQEEERRRREEEERRQREEEERRRREEEERLRREEEERKRREEEEERWPRRGPWRCYRYGVVHDDGPCGCSAPQDGGEYLCDE